MRKFSQSNIKQNLNRDLSQNLTLFTPNASLSKTLRALTRDVVIHKFKILAQKMWKQLISETLHIICGQTNATLTDYFLYFLSHLYLQEE